MTTLAPPPARVATNRDSVESLLREVRAEQQRQGEQLAAVLQLLERNRGARDRADVNLLVAIAEAIGDRPFSSAQLMAHASADPALRAALVAADIDSAHELGCVFRRMGGITLAGFRLARVHDRRAGIVWQVHVCED